MKIRVKPRSVSPASATPSTSVPRARAPRAGSNEAGTQPALITSKSPAASSEQDVPVLDLLQAVKDGRTNPVTFTADTRRMCVAHLGAQGYSVPEIAKVLRCSDRTITRDRRELQEASRIDHDPGLAGRVAGQLMNEGQHAMESLSRIARQRECPFAVQAECHRARIEVLDRCIQRIQSLGFLPAGGNAGPAQATWDPQVEVPKLIQIAGENPETRQYVASLQALFMIAGPVDAGAVP